MINERQALIKLLDASNGLHVVESCPTSIDQECEHSGRSARQFAYSRAAAHSGSLQTGLRARRRPFIVSVTIKWLAAKTRPIA